MKENILRKVKVAIACVVIFLFVTGCVVSGSIRRYQAIAPTIQLGSRIDDTLSILVEAKRRLPPHESKESVQYLDDEGNEIYIFFARSSDQGLDPPVLDMEFNPYIFYNGVLVAIGWESLDKAMHTK